MKTRNPNRLEEIQKELLGRRDLFKGAAAGAAALVGARAGGSALVKGVAGGAAALAVSGAGTALAQSSYTLTASVVNWDVGGGRLVRAWAYDDGSGPTVPGPTLYADAGETLNIEVVNNLPEPTSVHWHGVEPIDNAQDGVGYVTQSPIEPGTSSSSLAPPLYSFPAPAPGTYVYHSHVNTSNQMPRGLFGLLIVRDPNPNVRAANPKIANSSQRRYNLEYPLVLSTFPAEHAIGNWVPRGLDEIQLINGKTFYPLDPRNGAIDTATVLGEAFLTEMGGHLIFPMNVGDNVLFRTFNASAVEAHPMHTHGMRFTVVAEDMFDVQIPYDRCTLAINPGERFDLIARPMRPGLWLFHCHNLDHVAEGMIAVNVVS